MTIAYMQETAEEAGLPGVAIAMEDIGWDAANGRFVDLDEREIRTLCKLYPWEWIVAEPFGRNIPGTSTSWIEPIWKMVLSNKALLVLLWELFPDHPNLLPTYLNTPSNLTSYVQKPLLGREGASMRIVTPDGSEQRTQGDYGAEGFVFQEFCALPDFDGQRPVLGAWVVADGSAGIGIRRRPGSSPMTRHRSSRIASRCSGAGYWSFEGTSKVATTACQTFLAGSPSARACSMVRPPNSAMT